jgi:hypothetical protein
MIRWPADLGSLAREFSRARPFRHVVIDGALSADEHARITAAFDDEPHVLVETEIYLHLRSSDPPMTPALWTFHHELQSACAAVWRLWGGARTRAAGAAYVLSL